MTISGATMDAGDSAMNCEGDRRDLAFSMLNS